MRWLGCGPNSLRVAGMAQATGRAAQHVCRAQQQSRPSTGPCTCIIISVLKSRKAAAARLAGVWANTVNALGVERVHVRLVALVLTVVQHVERLQALAAAAAPAPAATMMQGRCLAVRNAPPKAPHVVQAALSMRSTTPAHLVMAERQHCHGRNPVFQPRQHAVRVVMPARVAGALVAAAGLSGQRSSEQRGYRQQPASTC